MAEILGMDGKKVEEEIPGRTPLIVLREVIAAIESGEHQIEELFIIAQETSPTNPAHVRYPAWDTNLTLAQSVYLLETCKHDIMVRAMSAVK